MNPFDPYSVASFLFHAGLLVALLACTRVGRSLLWGWWRRPPVPDTAGLDDHALAMVMGEQPRMVETALASLVLRGSVGVRERRRALAPRTPPPAHAPEMERTVFHALTTFEAEYRFGAAIVPTLAAHAEPAARETEAALRLAGLRHTAAERESFTKAAVVGTLVLGFIAFIVALRGFYQYERTPWPMVAVAALYLWAIHTGLFRVPRLTRPGVTLFHGTPAEREAAVRLLRDGGPADDAAWVRAVAWQGVAGIETGPLAPLARTLTAPGAAGEEADDEEAAASPFVEGAPAPADASGTFGYVAGGVARAATREELLRLCGAGHTPRLAWTPEDPVLRHPADVPFLFEALRKREEKALSAPVRNAAWMTALFLGMWGISGFPLASFWLLMAVAEGLQGAMAFREWRRALPVTAEALRRPAAPVVFSPWLLRTMAKPAVYTRWLLWAIGAVAAAQVLLPGDGIAAAGLVKDATRGGEWWRLLTGPMLHGHPLHLLGNWVTLEILGTLVERYGRRAHLPVVVLLSALAGSVASLLFVAETSVGISGGVMGCMGYLLVLGWRWRDHVLPGFFGILVRALFINAAIGLVGYAMIDNAAHAGGLLTGVTLGFVLLPSTPPEEVEAPGGTRAGWLAMAPLLAACALAIGLMVAAALGPQA